MARLIDADEAIRIWQEKDYIKTSVQIRRAEQMLNEIPTAVPEDQEQGILKPCPFCGREPYLQETHTIPSSYAVKHICTLFNGREDGVYIETRKYRYRETAIRVWNERYNPNG